MLSVLEASCVQEESRQHVQITPMLTKDRHHAILRRSLQGLLELLILFQ